MKLSPFLPAALAATVATQSTSTYTDPKSSLTFEAFQHTSGYTFGIALPTTPSTDFVGLLVGKGSGWAGVSLGGGMINKVLIAAWPNGNDIISSFRRAGAYAPPPEPAGALPYSLTPIANGTYVNSTHFVFTFLSKGCIMSDGSTFAATDANAVLGYALSTNPPSSKANHASELVYHDTMGQYGIDLAAAKGLWAGTGNGTVMRKRAVSLRGRAWLQES